MKKHFSFRFNPNRLFILMLLGMTCLCQNVKADNAGTVNCNIKFYCARSAGNIDQWWYKDGKEMPLDNVGNWDLGTITELWLKGCQATYWSESGKGNICTGDSKFHYAVYKGSSLVKGWTSVDINYATWNDHNVMLRPNKGGSTDGTFSSDINVLSNLIENGQYTLAMNFSTKGKYNGSSGCEDEFLINNGNKNYCLIFTYNPSTYITFGAGTGYATMGTVKCDGAATSPVWKYKNNQITFTAEPKTGYELEGWYSNAACTSKISDNTEYTVTYTSQNEASVYAKFVPLRTVTLVGFAIQSAYAGQRTTGSATISTPAGMQYDNYTKTGGVTNVQKDNNVMTFNATANGTLTANYIYLTPQVTHAGTANYTVGGAAIKLNPTYTNVANDATYTWTTTAADGKLTFSADNVANPNITITEAGTYSVTVTVSQDTASPKSASQTITINASGTGDPTCGSCFDY